ncbi:MAG: hypothetical protein KKA42_08280 [candidate division Zixibacteria bacterium]|nr:hypothetical protein [candidate division Zixibacteria bacterium]
MSKGELLRGKFSEDIRVSLKDSRTGRAIQVSPVSMTFTYSFPGLEGKSFAEFRIDSPGDYFLTAHWSQPEDTTRTLIALGRPADIWWLAIPFIGLVLIVMVASNVLLRRYIRQGRILPGLKKLRYGAPGE